MVLGQLLQGLAGRQPNRAADRNVPAVAGRFVDQQIGRLPGCVPQQQRPDEPVLLPRFPVCEDLLSVAPGRNRGLGGLRAAGYDHAYTAEYEGKEDRAIGYEKCLVWMKHKV